MKPNPQTTNFLVRWLRDQSLAQGGHKHKELPQWKAADRIEQLEKALNRQTENVAFVLNRLGVPEQWHEKFETELVEDREVLNAGI